MHVWVRVCGIRTRHQGFKKSGQFSFHKAESEVKEAWKQMKLDLTKVSQYNSVLKNIESTLLFWGLLLKQQKGIPRTLGPPSATLSSITPHQRHQNLNGPGNTPCSALALPPDQNGWTPDPEWPAPFLYPLDFSSRFSHNKGRKRRINSWKLASLVSVSVSIDLTLQRRRHFDELAAGDSSWSTLSELVVIFRLFRQAKGKESF